MLHSRPTARRRAARALAEGARPTLDLIAEATGRSLRTLRRDARKEGWTLAGDSDRDVPARLHRIASRLLDRIDQLTSAAADTGGRIDAKELEGLTPLIRGMEKIGEFMLPEEAADNEKTTENEDLADVLALIHERIVTLAMELADEICEERSRAERR